MVISRFERNNFRSAGSASSGLIHFYEPEGAWGWLANFSKHSIVIGDKYWKTVEHYFQAQKFAGTDLELEIWKAESPDKAKALAKLWSRYKRLDWESVRLSIMYEAIQAKFSQHQDLQRLLLSTGDAIIVENAEDDDFWGRNICEYGLNMMGKLIMMLRAEFNSNEKLPPLMEPILHEINW